MFHIVNYTPADRQSVRRICFDTGFLGTSMAPYVDNKEFFLDLATHYFLDINHSGLFLAKDGDVTAGYLFIEKDKIKHDLALLRYYLPRTLAEIPRFWRFTRRDVKYYFGVFRAWIRRDYFFTDFKEYPAVLHINIAKQYQRRGLGDILFQTMFNYLKQQSCPGVQLQTTSANENAIRFFKRHGFTELGSRPATLYRAYNMPDIRNIVMGCKINVQSSPPLL